VWILLERKFAEHLIFVLEFFDFTREQSFDGYQWLAFVSLFLHSLHFCLTERSLDINKR
jgi:hypothetical protein